MIQLMYEITSEKSNSSLLWININESREKEQVKFLFFQGLFFLSNIIICVLMLSVVMCTSLIGTKLKYQHYSQLPYH